MFLEKIMNHRHLHKRRHKKGLRYYVFIVIFLLIFIGLISYYIENKRKPSWNDEYLSNYISELNRDMGNSSGEVLAISQRMSIEPILRLEDMQVYELILQNEITGIIQGFYVSSEFNSFDRLFGTQWEGLYIQSAMRLTDDISWDEFEDVIEPVSNNNEVLADNFNAEQPGISPNLPAQDQEESVESGVTEEELEAISEQWAYNVGGGNIPGFTGGLPGSIGFSAGKSDDYANGGRQTPPSGNDNDPTPIPEPSTFILAGTGLLFLSRWFRRSRILH